MIKFQKIRWKNFLSTGNDFNEISLSTPGTTLVIGKNGAGKSTVADALHFALYGKPYRKINKNQLVNSINKKDSLVEVEFQVGDVQFLVRRGIKPNLFEIVQAGQPLQAHGAVSDTQEYFEKYVLKMNVKTFSQVVILGSANYVPFMELSASHRREVVEDVLDVGVFGLMSQALKNQNDELVKNIRESDYLRKNLVDSLELRRSYEAKTREDHESRMSDIDDKIKTEASRALELSALRKDVESELDVTTVTVKKYEELVNARKEVNFKKSHVDKELVRLHGGDHGHCSKCGQSVDDSHVKSRILELNVELDVLLLEADKLSQEIKAFSNVPKLWQDLNNRQSSLSTEINVIRKSILSLEADKKKIINDMTRATTLAGDDSITMQKKLDELDVERNGMYSTKDTYTYVGSLLKDGGVKTMIVREHISLMNRYINANMNQLGFNVDFSLDEEFNETIRSRFRDDFSYASFSEGEKARINLAILFAWRAIARSRNSASTNVVIMDEVFDSSLDSAGGDDFMKMLKSLITSTNAFVISHRTDTISDKFDRIIRFEKNKNFSSMVAA